MAFDRESTLKKAEKLLRQGRLDAAIAEYVTVVEDQPRDWASANALGDLYARGGQTDKAIEQYSRIAEHFRVDGFYPKAAALYKKILKINRDDEVTQLRLAEVSAEQGLLADAKSQLHAVARRRRERGDRRGEAEIIVRLGAVDPADLDARFEAARTLEQLGDAGRAAEQYRALHEELAEKALPQAMDALREFARLRPSDVAARSALVRAALDTGDVGAARDYLSRETAGSDPDLLLALAEVNLRAGDLAAMTDVLPEILRQRYESRHRLLELAWAAVHDNPEAAFACVDAVADAGIAASAFQDAATVLQDFVRRSPGHIASLLKLVEVCVDGGFETEMYSAQEQLTDAYLQAGQASEARVIAEDLVAREPWEPAHIDRFRRALVMLRVSDPDAEIAERLSGQSPFTATDRFIDLSDAPPPPVEAEANPGAEESAGVSQGAPPAEERPRPPSKTAPEEIDLTGALGSIDASRDAAPAGRAAGEGRLETVFARIREDAQTGADFSDQHMTLARTYLEMGNGDEAIKSLTTAARSPRLRFEAASMLGRLMMKRGDLPQAVEWLERASEAPAPTLAEGQALQYDFGVALDESGEIARALAVFLELQTDAGDYRDVPARIERLARAQTGG